MTHIMERIEIDASLLEKQLKSTYEKLLDVKKKLETLNMEGLICRIDKLALVNNQRANKSNVGKDLGKFKQLERPQLCFPCIETRKSLKSNFSDVFFSKTLCHNTSCRTFQTLVEIEDLIIMKKYLPLFQKNKQIPVPELRGKYYCLQVEMDSSLNCENILQADLDEVLIIERRDYNRLKKQFTNPIDILLMHEATIGTVTKVSNDSVAIEIFKDDMPFSLPRVAHVAFRPHRLPKMYQQMALMRVDRDLSMQKYLFPMSIPVYNETKTFPPIDLVNKSIGTNPEQLQAVNYILFGANQNAPFIIFGPPGTGKTTTIVEAILQVCLLQPKSRILVTSMSNTACDTIALRICEILEKDPNLFKDSKYKKPYNVLRVFSKSILKNKAAFKNIDSLLLNEYSNYQKGEMVAPGIEKLNNFQIIISTLCTVGKIVTGLHEYHNMFTHVFIDEAGACTEPETLIGIAGTRNSSDVKIVLSGDHKQLGPVLHSNFAGKNGLEVSLMERLMDNFDCYKVNENGCYDQTFQSRLRRNYRSHKEIVKLYNHLYYNNELIAEAREDATNLAKNWKILPNNNFPIIFQPVHGVTKKCPQSTSFYNDKEIDQVFWYLNRLLIDGIDGTKVKLNEIGIISPYKSQYMRIQKILKQKDWAEIKIGSAETFQGSEKKIIIVSMVKSFTDLGFICCPRRLNVILSRPQSLLIILGNPKTLKRNSDLDYIIKQCEMNGTFLKSIEPKRKGRN